MRWCTARGAPGSPAFEAPCLRCGRSGASGVGPTAVRYRSRVRRGPVGSPCCPASRHPGIPAGDDLVAQRIPGGLDSRLTLGHCVTGCMSGCEGCGGREKVGDRAGRRRGSTPRSGTSHLGTWVSPRQFAASRACQHLVNVRPRNTITLQKAFAGLAQRFDVKRARKCALGDENWPSMRGSSSPGAWSRARRAAWRPGSAPRARRLPAVLPAVAALR
jgi:hypothetical protein